MAIEVPSPVTNASQQTATPFAGPSGAGGTPEAFGGGVGEALFGLGTEVRALSDYVKQQDLQRQRFDAMRQFNAFEIQANQSLEESKRGAPTNLANFGELVTKQYRAQEAQFIKSLPPDMQQEFAVRTGDLGTQVAQNALTFQYQQTDQYFRNGIQDAYDSARNELAQGGTLEDLDAARMRVEGIISSTGLTAADKLEIRRKAYTGLEAVVYKQEQVRRLMADAQGGENGPAQQQAMDLLALHHPDNPEQLRAIATLGEQAAVKSVGLDTWAALPARVRASLIAAAADYQGLPEPVVAAVRSGDVEKIAASLEALPTPGADTLRDNIVAPGASLDDDPRFANLPYEDRLTLRQDAERQVAAAVLDQQQAETAQTKAQVNDLMVGLYDGTAGQADIDQARQDGWLHDIDDITKAQKIYDEAGGNQRLAAQAYMKMQTGQTFDPADETDKKSLNALVGKEGLAYLQQNNDKYVTALLVPIVEMSKDIPTDVAGLIKGMGRAADLTRANWAFSVMDQLQQASPDAFTQRFGADADKDLNFWRSRKDMYSTEELMKRLRGGLTPQERKETEALRGEALQVLQNDHTLSAVPVQAFSWFGGGPTVQGTGVIQWAAHQLTSDFNSAFVDEYVLHGNVNDAKAAAVADLQKLWGVTKVGGTDVLMRYPPQLAGYNPIQGSYDWIAQQTMDELNLSYQAAEGKTQIQNFQLISDEQTAQDVKSHQAGWWGGAETASYLVVIKDANGQLRQLFGADHLPLRISFGMTPELRQKQVDEFNQKRQAQIAQDDQRQAGAAFQHSLDTGIPIPPLLSSPDMYSRPNTMFPEVPANAAP